MSKGSTCKLKRVIGTPEVCVVVNHAVALATVSSTLAYDLIDDTLLDKCGKNTMEKIRLCEVDCCIIGSHEAHETYVSLRVIDVS